MKSAKKFDWDEVYEFLEKSDRRTQKSKQQKSRLLDNMPVFNSDNSESSSDLPFILDDECLDFNDECEIVDWNKTQKFDIDVASLKFLDD
jgi:hypothetical protein